MEARRRIREKTTVRMTSFLHETPDEREKKMSRSRWERAIEEEVMRLVTDDDKVAGGAEGRSEGRRGSSAGA